MKQKNPEMELGFILVMGVLAEIFQPIYYVFNRHLILISCHCISYITYLWTTWMFQIFSLSLFPLTCFLITELYPLQGCSCSKVASRSNFPLLVSFQWPLLVSFQWDVVPQVSSSLNPSCVSLPSTLPMEFLCSVPHRWEEEGSWSWGKERGHGHPQISSSTVRWVGS